MSIVQYKKVLGIAEALLAKVDIPQDTLAKYGELKLRLLGGQSDDNALDSQGGLKEELDFAKFQNTVD